MLKRFTLLAGLSLSAIVPAWSQGKTWAIVVGIDDYQQESVPDLRYACADAKILSQALQSLLKVPEDHLFVFTSDSVDASHSPTKVNLIYRLDWLNKHAAKDDVVVFYFAGHGAQVGADAFLLTQESDNRSLETLKASALGTGDLSRLIQRNPAARTLTILDACRNDPSSSKANPNDYAQGQFVVAGAHQESVGLLSCSVGQRSWELAEEKHGVFTFYLVNALRGKAADASGAITPNLLATYLLSEVPKRAQAVAHQEQTPRLVYDGPSATSWVLGIAAPASGTPEGDKLVRKLDAGAAKADLLQAQKIQLEARLLAEEALRKAAEARADAVEKRAQLSGPPSEEIQKLMLARDLALKELLETRKQLEQARTQLASRSTAGSPEATLMEAEKDQLKAENRVLQAKIAILEGRLQQSGVSMARGFTLEEHPPELARIQDLEQLAMTNPTPENRNNAAKAHIEKELADSKQMTGYLNGLVDTMDKHQLMEMVKREGLKTLQGEERNTQLTDILKQKDDQLAASQFHLGLAEGLLERAKLGESIAEIRLKEASLGQSEAARLSLLTQSFEASQAQNRRLVADYRDWLKLDSFRRRAISSDFRKTNSLPGFGDIYDNPPVSLPPEMDKF